MEFKLNNLEKCKQEVEFDIPYSELTPHFEKALKKYRDKVSIPGFRKGKVPVQLLKKMYGEAIETGSLEDVANDIFKDYIKNNEVHPLGEGALTDMNYDPGKKFTFKVQYEVKPEFEVNNYKGLEITKTVHTVDDHMIDDEVRYLQSKHATYENADRTADDNYAVTADVQKLDDTGVPMIGETEKDVKFFLNDSGLNPDLKNQLEGITANEERILSVSLKEKDTKEKYKAKVNKIEKIILPELTPEFFKRVMKKDLNSIEEFRNSLKDELETIYKNMSDQELRNNIVNELIKLNDIPVPDILVENILNSYIEDIKNQNPKRELPPDFDEAEYRKTKRVDAILQVKWYLIRDKIIELEKMEVTDEDMEPVIEADSKKYNIPVDKIRNVYKNNPDVKYKILDEKLINFLIQNSNVKEVVHSHEHKVTE
jgi:trigger factor